MPLTADLLDHKEMLDPCTDSAAGFPPAGGSGETLEGADDTMEHPSEKINLVGKAPWVTWIALLVGRVGYNRGL